jgi:hypothetical protein
VDESKYHDFRKVKYSSTVGSKGDSSEVAWRRQQLKLERRRGMRIVIIGNWRQIAGLGVNAQLTLRD